MWLRVAAALLQALVLALLALAWWVGRGEHGLPWWAGQAWDGPGSAFSVSLGEGKVVGQRLEFLSGASEGAALAVLRTPGLDTASHALLRYRVRGLSGLDELSLMWRRADDPSEVYATVLPHPGRASGWVRLDRLAEWQGTVLELGLASFPHAHQVPVEVGFRPWAIEGIALYPSSRLGRLLAVWHEWNAFQPWTLRSINSLGSESAGSAAPALAAVLALFAVLAALLLWLQVPAARRLGFVPVLLVMMAAGWVLMDLRWQRQLLAQNQASAALFASKPWAERVRLQADRQLIDDLAIARSRLRELDARSRIFVIASSRYVSRRAVYHLAPLNAGDPPLDSGPMPQRGFLAGDILLFYDHGGWIYSARSQRLEFGPWVMRVERLYESERMAVFRVLDRLD